jgi:hypothetical protein
LVRQGRSGTGRDWQEQLEDAVAARSTAFAVMVGTKGFDRSEARILSRSGDGTVHLWDVARLGPGNLVEAACRLPLERRLHLTQGLWNRRHRADLCS